jgi:PAS domain S-box-containing protein
MSNLPALFRSRYAKHVTFFVVIAVYVVVFFPLYERFRDTVIVLVVIPVIVATWFFGLGVGLVATVAGIFGNVILFLMAGNPWEEASLSFADLPGVVALVVVCLTVGFLRRARNDLHLELARRQKAEDKLQEREHFVEKILAAAPILIYIYDVQQQRTTYIAGRILKDMGYSPGELLALGSRVLTTIIHEDDQSRIAEHFQRMMTAKDDQILEISYRWKTASGGWRCVVDRQLVFARTPDGKISQLLGTSQDITERVEVEALLQAERDLLRTIIDNIPDQIGVRDADGRFILTNHTLDMRGQVIPREQVIGRTVHDLFPGDDARLFLAEDHKVFQTGQRLINMERVIEYNGLKRWFLSTKVPLRDQNRKINRVLVLSREITDLKETEFARLESEKQRVALQTERELTDLKARFITHMSHEIRTPLAILNSSAFLLHQHHDRLVPERRSELLESIQTQVMLLRNVLDGVSAVMGDEDTLFGFSPVPSDLGHICRGAINDIVAVHPRTIEFSSSGSLEAVLLDPNMIAYIFKTFLLNAILYSPPDSPIFAEARRVKDTATIIVTDQGLGIPTRDQGRIFEAFHRGSNVGVVRGTGVSLWISQNYARQHGGSITFATIEKEGSVFTLLLPTH